MATPRNSSYCSRSTLLSFAAGAGVMFFADPIRGRARRAILRDKLYAEGCYLRDFMSKAGRDLEHRTRGLMAEARHMMDHETPDDETLVARVRSQLGRIVSHPHAIRVTASQGRITLRGPILGHEVEALLACVHGCRGVIEVDNLLEPHGTPGRLSALQGRPAEHGSDSMIRRASWTPGARALIALGGGGMALLALSRRGPASSSLALLGGVLMAWGLSNPQRHLLPVNARFHLGHPSSDDTWHARHREEAIRQMQHEAGPPAEVRHAASQSDTDAMISPMSAIDMSEPPMTD